MFIANTFDVAIPEPGKHARGLGVPNGSVRHTEFGLQHVRRKRVDDFGGVFLFHDATMPNSLSLVKPNERELPQVFWHGRNHGMDITDRPFFDIAERIRWHRAIEGLEQKEYAEKAGLKRAQLSNWESGDYRLSIDGARALRKTYGLSLDFLFEGIEDALPMTLRAAWRDKL